ncbi:MAG: GlsB/YeaQ/YmgE family stress response membrane protein [Marinilabiliaceae bacterium]|nr:GlsB/YeaQ/YmgE family stress response membrane protein [Marinilabiliaceae bacterium]
MELIWFILIGIVAGFLAGQLMKGKGFGVVINLLVGVGGAILGGWLLGVLGFSFGGGLIGSLVTAFLGAVVLLFIISLFKKK